MSTGPTSWPLQLSEYEKAGPPNHCSKADTSALAWTIIENCTDPGEVPERTA